MNEKDFVSRISSVKPDDYGRCYSYYGCWNIENKPHKGNGVAYFMLDEHVRKIIKNQKSQFKQEVFDVLSDFAGKKEDILRELKELRHSISEVNRSTKNEIDSMKKLIGEMSKMIISLVDTNKLEMPEVKVIKGRGKGKKTLEEQNEMELC